MSREDRAPPELFALNGGRQNGSVPERRELLLCIVPRELAEELSERLEEHWEGDRSVRVVVERRRRERRRIQAAGGQRVGERREAPREAVPPELPAFARRYAERLLFVERVAPGRWNAEDEQTNRLLLRAQSGDMEAFGEIYRRHFDRIYTYARVALCDPHEAEDVTQQVFANVLRALPRYEVRRDSPFGAWLFRIARNAVLRALARNGRFQIEEPAELDRRIESPSPEAMHGREWVSDHQLAILVERLPPVQRQVIVLRYLLDYSTEEIADVVGRTPVAVRMLEHRAMRTLQARLIACQSSLQPARDATPAHSPMLARVRSLPVTSSRRIALEPITRTLGWQPLRATDWRRSGAR
jgi:RNA polymerase sigma-70 factor (ECF subfamily)